MQLVLLLQTEGAAGGEKGVIPQRYPIAKAMRHEHSARMQEKEKKEKKGVAAEELMLFGRFRGLDSPLE